MDEIVQEFLVESGENLDQLDRDLLALEVEPTSREALASAFRTIHTIKGTSGFLAFNRLEQLTHTGESLLSRLRDGQQRMSTATADVLLEMVDTVRALLATIEADGSEGEVETEAVSARLRALLADPTSPPTVREVIPAPAVVAAAPAPAPAPPPPALPAVPAPVGELAAPARRSAAEGSLRVDVEVLDTLMQLAGELVLARNQLLRGVGALHDPALTRTAQRLSAITTELQESIMQTRMQPIDHLWSRLPRVVRDLGAQCGRQVRLLMTGQDTELDRALLEAIKDPLTHLVRNAVDHGIEPPETRVAAGKPAEGTVHLRSYHHSGQVVVEVADDGAGIDPARVAQRALERGLRSAAQLAEMSDGDVLHLVFHPGFSTATTITTVSGRGVGMDVVKTNIESIGGTIELESTPGTGTVCRLRVPLTLAIVPALTVACATERFAIPQSSLLELVAVEAAAIEDVAGAPVYRLRGALLPLVDLARELGLRHDHARGAQVVVVVQAGSRRFGLLVDGVVNTEEIVVKALSPVLRGLAPGGPATDGTSLYSGATILGDGRVALILDVQNLARRGLHPDLAERNLRAPERTGSVAEREPQRLLVATVGEGRQVAIAMAVVTRLEMIAAARVEQVGTSELVQHRGAILPLVRLSRYLDVPCAPHRTELPVAVCSRGGRSVAVVVEEILDIAEHDGSPYRGTDDRRYLGTVVVKGQIVGVVDVERAIRSVDPDFGAAVPEAALPGPAIPEPTAPEPTAPELAGAGA
ncbi:chemotaxis protein CheW [Rhodococcus sp. X156]|uniref:chemotaxis protein CheW n=1 Tax=Rhodococcus sp. X156 TaxID=2499145 RepID=UPI0019D06260|nr:chemotaxis protein CheW [Rhodococcus sp. X156]